LWLKTLIKIDIKFRKTQKNKSSNNFYTALIIFGFDKPEIIKNIIRQYTVVNMDSIINRKRKKNVITVINQTLGLSLLIYWLVELKNLKNLVLIFKRRYLDNKMKKTLINNLLSCELDMGIKINK